MALCNVTYDCITIMSNVSGHCSRRISTAAMTYLCALQLLGSWLRSSLVWWPQVSRAPQRRAPAPPCLVQPGPARISQTPPSPPCTSLPMVPTCIQLHCIHTPTSTSLCQPCCSFTSASRQLWVLCPFSMALSALVHGKVCDLPSLLLHQSAAGSSGCKWT